MSNDLKNVFRETAGEFLLELEEALLQLENNPEDTAEIDRMFRVMHTIKGSAAMVDLNDVAQFAHTLESECDYLRQGQAKVSPEIIRLALKAHDCISSLIESHYGGAPVDEDHLASVLKQFADARKATMVQNASEAFGYERTSKLMKAIGKELASAKKHPDREKLTASVGQKFTLLYYLLVIQNKESAAEFLSKLEAVFRAARIERNVLPAELFELAREMLDEVDEMYNDSGEVDESDFDPVKIMMAMQHPIELNNRLNVLAEKIQPCADGAVKAPEIHRIKIVADERGPGALTGIDRFEKTLARLGTVLKIRTKNA